MPQSQTLVTRSLLMEVRGPRGVVATCRLAHCTCLDFTWRDRAGTLHFCKHIIHVYARHQHGLRKGRKTFRVRSFDPDRAAQGVVYKVTVFSCTLPDGTRCPDSHPGVMELCLHLRRCYEDAGFPAGKAPAEHRRALETV